MVGKEMRETGEFFPNLVSAMFFNKISDMNDNGSNGRIHLKNGAHPPLVGVTSQCFPSNADPALVQNIKDKIHI